MTMSKQKCLERGFCLSDDGYDKTKGDLEKILNTDMKEIGKPFFPVDASSRSFESLSNPNKIVLQVKSVKNAAASKIDESRASKVPRLLKIHLTDGFTTVPALEMSKLPGLGVDITTPGTKIQILQNPIQLSSGFILLESESIKVLGGRVENLVEKWEISRRMASFTREKSNSGPPKWVPFGKKIDNYNVKHEPNKEVIVEDENSEFDSQRKDAIEEAQKTGDQKIFGGGKQDIKDGKRYNKKDDERGNRRKGRRANKENETESAKPPPSSGVSLLDFVESKIPSLKPDLVSKSMPDTAPDQYTEESPYREKQRDNLYPPRNFNSNGRSSNNNNGARPRKDRYKNEKPQQKQHFERKPSNPGPKKQENSDRDFGEWTNSTYTETQQRPKKYQDERVNSRHTRQWCINDPAMARYSGDGKFYPVVIKNLNRFTAVVMYENYNEFAEVHYNDLKLRNYP